jgi:hypothetical protein
MNNTERPNIAQWGCLVMLLGIITLTVVGGVWLFTKPASRPEGPRPTAIIQTATPSPTPVVAPTPTPIPVLPDQIRVGVTVTVVGTAGAGLSIRAQAGTGAERVNVAAEGESLLIVAGPQLADGYTWWFVRDELNPEREGWAAQDFLAPPQ